ncbi:MAG TPA: sugar ABC transporter permease, partial [Acidimicrobiales bacterium]|nr:sugar ABC transporter permease [Acidimicrobiales bacterium]
MAGTLSGQSSAGGAAASAPGAVAGAPARRAVAVTARERRDGRGRRGTGTLRKGENLFGWLFVSPALAILLLFLVIPIFLALYISFTNWTGLTNPLSSSVHWVGLANYRTILTQPGLDQTDFGTAVRDNFYFVVFTVPLQTALALWLAVLLNNRLLRAKGFFRTAFYFPSVTSSIAITVVFIFLFQGTGVVNTVLGWFGISGPNWLYDTQGVIWNALGLFGINSPPGWAQHNIIGIPVWSWLAGPSVGMCVMIALVVWTTSGTFMLFFLAALQNIGEDVDEASAIDGTTPWQRFRYVTLPLLRPALVLVLTLRFISTWQVFDQSYLLGPNNPTTITPAFFSYQVSFQDSAFGVGAAVAFLLFCLIV